MMNEQKLSEILNSAIDKWNVPGATCGIWSNGEYIGAQAGVLNTDSGETVKPISLFQIGSITKVLTASLVMVLVDQGKIALDEPVRSYVPDFRIGDLEASKSITVRQLLNHTNGIAGDFMPDTGMGPDRLERYLLKCTFLPLCHDVGENLSYSNAAYCIAGLLIERVSGLSFEDAMKKWIFEPLGLENSVVNPMDVPGRSASAGHAPDTSGNKGFKPLPTIYYIAPSTAPAGATVMMNAEDLIAFARMHLNDGKAPSGEQVLSPESVAEMQKMDVTIPVPQRNISHWGVGWFFLEQGENTLFGHDGGTIGQAAFLRIHKPTGTIVCLMVNGGSSNDCMFDVFSQTLEPMTGFKHSPSPEPASAGPDDLSKYEGRFETIATVTDFWVEDGQLKRRAVMTLDDKPFPEPESTLEYAGDDLFLNAPPNGGRPSLVCFLEPDADGVPQVLFAGLRVGRRTGPAVRPE